MVQSALAAEDAHGRNVAIGYAALENQNAGADAYNVAMGYRAGYAVSTGTENSLIGGNAGVALTTGSYNVALGNNALSVEDTGSRNVAIGTNALQDLNYAGNAYNVAIGFNAGTDVTDGIENTANWWQRR